MASLAEKIRAEPGLTSTELARKLGCSASYVRGQRSLDRTGLKADYAKSEYERFKAKHGMTRNAHRALQEPSFRERLRAYHKHYNKHVRNKKAALQEK